MDKFKEFLFERKARKIVTQVDFITHQYFFTGQIFPYSLQRDHSKYVLNVLSQPMYREKYLFSLGRSLIF